jgi:hypothetical protein
MTTERADPLEMLEEEAAEGKVPCEACDGGGVSIKRPGNVRVACAGLGWREP